jgi:hypothetical protein
MEILVDVVSVGSATFTGSLYSLRLKALNTTPRFILRPLYHLDFNMAKKSKKSASSLARPNDQDNCLISKFASLQIDQTTPSVSSQRLDASAGPGRPTKRNIVKEFDVYFGNTSKLANWQMLCRDLGIEGEDELNSITKCKQV